MTIHANRHLKDCIISLSKQVNDLVLFCQLSIIALKTVITSQSSVKGPKIWTQIDVIRLCLPRCSASNIQASRAYFIWLASSLCLGVTSFLVFVLLFRILFLLDEGAQSSHFVVLVFLEIEVEPFAKPQLEQVVV